MRRQILIGVLVSAVFLYLSLRGVDFRQPLEALTHASYPFLLLTFILNLLVTVLRTVRWGVLLSPLEPIGLTRLYPVVCVGYLAIILLPARMGELVRPWLLSRNSRVPASSALATVFVERTLDMLTLAAILFGVVLSLPLPRWITRTGWGMLPVIALLALLIGLLAFRADAVARWAIRMAGWCPRRFRGSLEQLLTRFSDGLQIVGNPRKFFVAVLLSGVIWCFSGYSIYTLFRFQGLQLPAVSAFVVLIVIVLGISLPTAPGMVGNFQMGCIVALGLFNVPKSEAFFFSMMHYALGIGLSVALGLFFLPTMGVAYKDFKRTAAGWFLEKPQGKR